MKILWCHPAAWSGEYKMMRYLASQGHRICVLQSDRKLNASRYFAAHFRDEDDGIEALWYNPSRGVEKLLTFPVDRFVRRSSYRGNLGHRMWMVGVAARHFRPDVVFCSEGFGYGVAAALLKRLGGLPYPLVVQFIGGDLMDEPVAQYGVRRTTLSTKLLTAVGKIPTLVKPVSPLLANILCDLGTPETRIRICPSHLVADRETCQRLYRARSSIAAKFRKQWGISPDAKVVVTLSGNWEGKGTQFLAQAWENIRRRVPGCHWLLAGPHPNWYREHIAPLVQRFPEEIHVLGELRGEGVFECLAAADLNVNPTLADGLNMVTVEAAAVGTPSLVTDKAGIAAWVAECDQTLVLPTGDVNALEEGVAAFFERSHGERATLSEKFKRMSEGFAVEVLAGEFLKVLLEAQRVEAKDAV